jgi:hypothetical protein
MTKDELIKAVIAAVIAAAIAGISNISDDNDSDDEDSARYEQHFGEKNSSAFVDKSWL